MVADVGHALVELAEHRLDRALGVRDGLAGRDRRFALGGGDDGSVQQKPAATK